jgi:hypothetical protein
MTPMTLNFTSAETTIDLTSFIAANGQAKVTQVDLTGTGNNTIRLSLADVLQMTEENASPLLISGNDGDIVELLSQGHELVQSTSGNYIGYDLNANGVNDLLIDQQVRLAVM